MSQGVLQMDIQMVLASANEDKCKELYSILKDMPIDIVSLKEFPVMHEVVEDGETFEANAIKKAHEVSMHTGLVALADDSGLEIDCLNGQPGVFSARFAGPKATYRSNIDKVLDLMQGVPLEKRTARFVCCIALVSGEEVLAVVRGECEGLITIECSGVDGFGYDPIFFIPSSNKTFAEMTSSEKNKISHRGNALEKIRHLLTQFVTK